MDDRQALIAGIIENPNDTLRRLVFADWLDEHSESEWAWFIRHQCEPDYQPDWLAASKRVWSRGGCGYYPTPEQTAHKNMFQDLYVMSWPTDGTAVYRHKRDHHDASVYIRFSRGFVRAVESSLDTLIGRPCRACGGSGMQNGFSAFKCSNCQGQCRIGGVLPEIAKEHPVELVKVNNLPSVEGLILENRTLGHNYPNYYTFHVPHIRTGQPWLSYFTYRYTTRESAENALSKFLIEYVRESR